MKKNNKITCTVSVLLVLVLMTSLCPYVFAASREIRIGNAEELAEFAGKCSSDSYSKELTVILTNDIDLDGKELSVPIFLGTFDGAGHKITGLKISSENSRVALFGIIAEGAAVKNLIVEGDVSPAGTQNTVGGIAGENYGTIENCSFSGMISGTEKTGGIAAVNGASGTITDCSVSGVIRGSKFTGGITGENSGSVIRCLNEAAVNTTVTEEDLVAAELEELSNAVYDLLKNRDQEYEISTSTDTGGIAGYSTGVIQSCENKGTVGYPHVGYNVGGIAGRQSGYISNCTNTGKVLGRKDVGGIVGQMVPNVTLSFSPDGLDELQKELNTMQSLIDKTLDDTEKLSTVTSGHLTQVSGYVESARKNANDMVNQLSEFADSNIQSINGLSLLVSRYLSKLTPIISDLSDASTSMTSAISEMRKLLEILDGTTEYNDQLLLQIKEFCTETSQACGEVSEGLQALKRAFAYLGDTSALPDTSKLESDIAALSRETEALNTLVQKALDEYEASGTVSAETRAALAEQLKTVFSVYSIVVKDLNEVLKNTDFSAILTKTIENIRGFSREMQSAMDLFISAFSHMDSAMNALGRATDTLRELNTVFDEAGNQLDTVLAALHSASSSLDSSLKKAVNWAKELSAEEPVTFHPLGAEFTASSEALNAALEGMNGELSALNTSASDLNAALISDLRDISNQFMKIMNLFMNLVRETQNIDYTDVFKDVSEEELQSASLGKVQESANYGEVAADRNVGGVVGAMAIEYDFDPEDDLIPENRSGRFVYQTRAILLDCKNGGKVTSKRDCAGGVVGRMDLGTVYGCGGFGETESESGSYVGGVCGFSLSSIKNSFSKCSLSGKKYVGGIVGSGKRVYGCISMVEIDSQSAVKGAIAGEITDEYESNIFVSDNLAGVDRISYSGKAEPVEYSKLCESDNVPDEMKVFVLRFIADGNELKSLTFSYGDSLSLDVAPEIPAKEGYYAVWDRTELLSLHFDTTVTAEYIPYTTTVAGNDTRDGKNIFFVEGDFDTSYSFSAEKGEKDISGLPDIEFWQTREMLESWTIDLGGDGKETRKVHYLAPDGETDNILIFINHNGTWEKADSYVFGSYIVFDADSSQTEFAVVRQKLVWWIWCVFAFAALWILLCIIAIADASRRRKSRKNKKIKAADAESTALPENTENEKN